MLVAFRRVLVRFAEDFARFLDALAEAFAWRAAFGRDSFTGLRRDFAAPRDLFAAFRRFEDLDFAM